MTFTIEDIRDRVLLDTLIREEANRIFNSPVARKDRSFETIYDNCSIGKVAELYMVEREGYSFADIPWHDLKAGNEYFEVKAYNVYNWNAPFVKRDLERYKNASWCKAKWYMLFSCKDGVYNLIGIKEI